MCVRRFSEADFPDINLLLFSFTFSKMKQILPLVLWVVLLFNSVSNFDYSFMRFVNKLKSRVYGIVVTKSRTAFLFLNRI